MSLSPIRRGSEEHDDPVLSKAVKAGRRTYFFDVRATRSDDYFLTITESRKMTDARGEVTFDRHKIFLYKEDFDNSCRNSPKRSRSSALGRPQQQRTKSKEPRAGSGHSLSYGRGDLPKPAHANISGVPDSGSRGCFVFPAARRDDRKRRIKSFPDLFLRDACTIFVSG